MMNPNHRPLSMRKKVQLMVALTILAWATQTLFHQWGFGNDLSAQERLGHPAQREGTGLQHQIEILAWLAGEQGREIWPSHQSGGQVTLRLRHRARPVQGSRRRAAVLAGPGTGFPAALETG